MTLEERARRLEGRRVRYRATLYDGSVVDDVYRVQQVTKWLPAGPTASGGVREHDLLVFTCDSHAMGSLHTVRAKDLRLV